jgi:predicted RNA-binding Zn ribbon-like protein
MYMVETEDLELTENRVCLDFVNTLDGRPSERPHEQLNNFADLVSWSKRKHLLTDEQAQHLLEEEVHHQADAREVLQQAIVLREALFRIFEAIADDASPSPTDLALLNTSLARAMCHACIVPKAEGFVWTWTDKENALESILWPVAKSAADLLTSDQLDDVRLCAAEDCDWLFLDTSKNHSRRWCDMKSCGNRAKAKRHYHKKVS